MTRSSAAIGFTVKSGWASAVLLEGPATDPRVVDSRRIELSDPKIPDSRQPYHEGFGTARGGGRELTRLLTSVKRYGQQSTSTVIREYADLHTLKGVGIVVGSLIDPATIANDHIRIHALEGQLFRGVIESAAARGRLPRSIWRERDLGAAAVEILDRPETQVRNMVAGLGKSVTGPWRAEQKCAALAAWLVLSKRS